MTRLVHRSFTRTLHTRLHTSYIKTAPKDSNSKQMSSLYTEFSYTPNKDLGNQYLSHK